MFFKEVSSAHQACVYLIQNTAKTVKYFYYYIFEYILKCNLFHYCRHTILQKSFKYSDLLIKKHLLLLLCWKQLSRIFLSFLKVQKNSIYLK